MKTTRQSKGWSLDQGLAAQYAAQAGLDPDLAAAAGSKAWDVLKSLRDATSETDPKHREKFVRRTKARIAKAGLSRHRELVQHIEAKLMALQGRGEDTELAHLTPGEVIVPLSLQTPEVTQALRQAAHSAGVDLAGYTAGSTVSSVNPATGLAEYVNCGILDPECRNKPDRGFPGPEYGTAGNPVSPPPAPSDMHVTGSHPNLRTPWWQQPGFGPSRVESGAPASGGPGGMNQIDPADHQTAEPIDTLLHRFVYNPDGSLAPNQPRLTLHDPDNFDATGRFNNWGSHGPQDPPGLATNNGLPEEIVVKPNPDAETSLKDWLTGVESEDVIENWSNEKILRELRKFENVYIPGGQGNMKTTATRGMGVISIFGAGQTARDLVYSERLRQVCNKRGLEC